MMKYPYATLLDNNKEVLGICELSDVDDFGMTTFKGHVIRTGMAIEVAIFSKIPEYSLITRDLMVPTAVAEGNEASVSIHATLDGVPLYRFETELKEFNDKEYEEAFV